MLEAAIFRCPEKAEILALWRVIAVGRVYHLTNNCLISMS